MEDKVGKGEELGTSHSEVRRRRGGGSGGALRLREFNETVIYSSPVTIKYNIYPQWL